MRVPSLKLSLLVLLINVANGQSENEQSWSCPTGWRTFTESGHIECLWKSSSTASSYQSAYEICQAFDANLVTVFSDEKFNTVKDLLSLTSASSVWTGLKKNDTFRWQTINGWKEMTYGSFEYDHYSNYYSSSSNCGVLKSYQSLKTFSKTSCEGSSRAYICEKSATCVSGWYGGQCENQCHCHGQPCDSNHVNATCAFGCQSGWRGPSCNKPIESAQATYHCVDPANGEKRVSILIDNKGIEYRAIEAVDDEDEPVSWCNGTEIRTNDLTNSVTISISMDDQGVSEIGQTCAGKVTGNQTYEWRISLKEWKGILMPMDQIIEVQCDFNNAESLSRTGDPVITEEIQATSVSQLDHTEESITVKLIDTASKRKLFSSAVGSPVILQVHHDFEASANIKSISPYNCEATSDDGTQQLPLLDSNGCQVDGSPVKPFARTSQSNTLETSWFPYFAFKGSSSVVFRCSFIFCFDDNCPVGCSPNGLWPTKGRHVRSTRADVKHQAEDNVGVTK